MQPAPVQFAVAVQLCKINTNAGLHAGCGDLEHPCGRIQALRQLWDFGDGLAVHNSSQLSR
jgi:hypothetical protein